MLVVIGLNFIMFDTNLIIQKQLQDQMPKPGKTGVDWYLFCYFLNKFKNKPMMEIGAGNGGSLYTMFAFTKDITVVDSWDFGWDKETVDNHLQSIDRQAIFVYKRSEDLTVRELKNYDFVHLDANKSYEGTLRDLVVSSKCCTGIICVDDYMNSVWPEVTWAVDDFIQKYSSWKKIFVGNHQIFLADTTIKMQELVADFPLVNRNNVWYLTYGELPKEILPFVDNGKMTYSWHDLVWGDNKEKL